MGVVAYEAPIDPKGRLYWKGWRPTWVDLNTVGANGMYPVRFRFIRGTFNPDKLVTEAANHDSMTVDRPSTYSRFSVTRLKGKSAKDMLGMGMGQKLTEKSSAPASIGNSATEETSDLDHYARIVNWKPEDIGERIIPGVDPLDRLSLSEDAMEGISEVQRWFKSKDWYFERQIPWRRGLLLHGRPGTGKSSMAKALAQHLKIPIFVMDISTMDNTEFYENYSRALLEAPAVVLIEDIDAVFHGRENVVAEKSQGLTFDCLLNTISGVESSDGILLIITTNNIDKLDPAIGVPQPGSLSTRPGRIDRAIELPVLDTVGRRKLAKRIMAGCHESWVEYLVSEGKEDTGAQFEDRCAITALNLFWSDNPQASAPVHIERREESVHS
jgi:SpoVK/Ycf46/Vps4 family AAA+-type ATPase